ncbi:calcium-dependent protein kinase [Mactra antiquata]
MLSLVLFAVCVGLSSQQMPHGHELTQLVDQGFNFMDTDKNGILSLEELSTASAAEDLDGDGQISFAEYMKYTNQTDAVARPMFNAYDTDGDGMLPLDHMGEYLTLMDKNGDRHVDKNEYEHYTVKLIQCIYSDHGHGSHGHAASCVTQH